MAIRNIRLEGDEILKKKSKPVEEINEKILTLIEDMFETMYAQNGLGLAAVQVGVLKRVVVIDVGEETREPFVLINPKIIKTKGEHEVEEGCLSFPNKFAKVIRPKEVTVEALNEKGEKYTLTGKDLLAQAIVHECDHLEGEVFVDKIVEGTLQIVTPEEKTERKENKKTNKK